MHFYTRGFYEKQLNCFATSVFRKQKVRKYNKADHYFQKEWKSLDCEIFEIISRSRIYGPMSYGKGNWIVCFIFKTQPLKRCFHSNKVNTSSHYRPSSFLIVGLKIFFKYYFKSAVKKYSFSDHSSEPKNEEKHTWSIEFLMFYGLWAFMAVIFSERSLPD